MRLLLICVVCLCFLGTMPPEQAVAKPKYLFKIASLAPEGSIWINQFKNFAKEVEQQTGGEVGFRIYAGGIMGDETTMYRKMRKRQLHGGGFTMTGIAMIVPDFRVMSIPFLFHSYAEVDAVTDGLLPNFRESFSKQGLEFVAMTEVGFIYTMSTKPITTTKELQKATSWIPAGDPLATAFFSHLGVAPVQLSIPDVLSSLQTGLVDTVYNSLYGSIVLQWFTKAKFITDTPFAYAYGVFLLDKRKFDKMPQKHQKAVHQAAAKYFPLLIDQTRKSNEESRQVMAAKGVKFIDADPASLDQLESFHEATVKELIGESFSKEIYQKITELLAAYRNGSKGGGAQ